MKRLVFPLLIVLLFANCSKNSQSVAQIDPAKTYAIKYDATPAQSVVTRVNMDTLFLNFNENVIAQLDPQEYSMSWAIILQEDFSKSYLNGLHFDALASKNGYAHDWVPQNLNDAAPGQVTSTSVTVGGKNYTQVTVNRTFVFYNVLSNNQAAVDAQNTLLGTSTDAISFKLYFSYNLVNSLANSATFRVVYSK
ncbi:MAG: hypothetical protein J7539_12770 [Niabella sp.]|nr:hypothetical protein [Niabella sp.]